MLNSRGSFLSNLPPVTKNLIIINFIIWIFCALSPTISSVLFKYGALHYTGASDFNVAQFFTYMFLHDNESVAHVLFNMFTLFMFGRTLETVFGSKRFLFFYLSCGIGAALIQELVWFSMADSIINDILGRLYSVPSSEIPQLIEQGRLSDLNNALEIAHKNLNYLQTVGASGAIFGILVAFGMLFPNLPLYLFFVPVPIKAKWMVIGYGVIELLLGMSRASDGIAHFAHLGGMLFGVLLILYWRKKGVIHGPLY